MANKVEISAGLKRNLKIGKEYNKLIPSVKCERTNLGEGDTFKTVNWMKGWIEKYNYQTAKISPILQGRSLQETVNNIYQFLYDHVQYTADGPLQQLRSPACTWTQRKKGVDCKSYSVFASSVLSNLGIKHFIRQIRQPYFYPEEFTHVYVVVPIDQTVSSYQKNTPTYVLDATKHQNTESDYIEKSDVQMVNLKNIGLNAPQQDSNIQKISENFNTFSKFLLRKGVPLESVNAVRDRVSKFTSKGIDPNIEIISDGLKIQGLEFPLYFKEHVPFLVVREAFGGPKGLGFTAAFGGSNPSTGLGFSFGAAFSSIKDKLKGGEINTSGKNPTTGIVDAGLTLASGAIPFGGMIKGLMDTLNISQNIGNVLKYGLSSWGASKTPEGIKKTFAESILPWLQDMLAKTTMDNISTQLTAIDVNLRGNSQYMKKLKENHSRAKSTRIANEWVEKECMKLLGEVLAGFNKKLQEAGVAVTKTKVQSNSAKLKPFPIIDIKGKDVKADRYWDEIPYYIYTVDQGKLKNWNSAQMNIGGSNVTPSSGNTYQQPTNNYQQPVNTNYQQPANNTANINPNNTVPGKSNTGLIIAGVAAAALPFLFFMKKSPVNTPAKKSKK